jgi:DNA repair protein RadC
LIKALGTAPMQKLLRSFLEAVVEVAARWMRRTLLLERYGTLVSLMGRPLDELAGIRGIKAVRAIRLAAAYEFC